jgi:hypothetical protein
MQRVSTTELIEAVAALMGLDARSAQMDAALATAIGSRLDERVRQGWQREMWPFACEYSARQFAADWATGTTYAAGTVVLGSDDVYHVSQAGTNLGHDPVGDDGTWWLTVTEHAAGNPDFAWVSLIAHEQAWETTAWHEVSRAWATSPLTDRNAIELRLLVTADGVVVHPAHGLTALHLPARVVLLLRPWPPRVCGRPWAAGTYAAGAAVYHLGESWVASSAAAAGDVPGTAAKWVLQQVPRDLKPFAVHAAYADMLRVDGQTERAFAEGRVAASILDDIAERVITGQQQTQYAAWSER